ncbi:hypothetical protein [Coleofasciculus sp. FACHB-1120]|uniref:hypothetical protein n=1 Tax=Coleofasciculus sp. FACHB-1120 TaxID=2692783 RepID=UPI001682755B|nr:hypothetical protein [Coleofasciculus sp. FACHB-1120]MBD2743154.1 hypothetical protein [Coleofasciculus sp. FACHB-1120]
MQENTNNIRNTKAESFRTTLIIFGCSLLFFAFLTTISLIKRNEPIGSWFPHPIQYPYSFSMTLFVALSCSAATIWTLRYGKQDINLALVMPSILVGCLLDLYLITHIDMAFAILVLPFWWIVIIFLILGIVGVSVLISKVIFPLFHKYPNFSLFQAFLLSTVATLGIPLYPLLKGVPILFSFLFLYLSCSVTKHKPPSLFRRTTYLILTITIILMPYFFAVITKHTPGLIVPASVRNDWGHKSLGYFYEDVVDRLKNCQKLKAHIGVIRATALAEGEQSSTWDIGAGGDFAQLTVEVVGEKGTAIVKSCYFQGCLPSAFKQPFDSGALIYTKSGVKNLALGDICP